MNTHIPKVVTHSGRFHSDDCFAVATLKLVFGDIEIVRSRDPEVIGSADIVLDIGGVYDPEQEKFDHHQILGAGFRENGIPFASFGLIWKKYGSRVCGSDAVALYIDKTLVTPIDAMDNGVNIMSPLRSEVLPVLIQNIVFLHAPAWNEDKRTYDQGFLEMVSFAQKILERAIVHAKAYVEAEGFVKKAYETASDKRILILEDRYPYNAAVEAYKDVLFVVLPDSQPSNWKVETVTQGNGTYTPRKKLPENWAGKRDVELESVTGVKGAIFCHRALFMAVANSKEGALELAHKALAY